LTSNAQHLSQAVRSHWWVENSLHWVLYQFNARLHRTMPPK
jgi:predicted transposase YbfD/YdcC